MSLQTDQLEFLNCERFDNIQKLNNKFKRFEGNTIKKYGLK